MLSFYKKFILRLQEIDLFNLGVVFGVWYGVAYFLVPLAIGLGLRSTYLRAIVEHELFLYSWQYFGIAALGIVSFGLGFWLISRKSKRVKPVFAELNPISLKFLFVLTYGAGLVVKILKVLTGTYFHLGKNPAVAQSLYSALLGIGEWLGILGLGIGFGLYFSLRKQNKPEFIFWQRLIYGVFALELVYNFFTLSKMSLLAPLAAYLITRHYVWQKDLRHMLAWAFIFQFLLAPLQSRLNVPQVLQSYVASWEKKVIPQTVVGAPVAQSLPPALVKPLAAMDFVADGVFARLDQSRILAKILFYNTGFSYGKGLENFFISLGPPRFLWLAKPLVNAGHNEFGRAYHILDPSDYTTSVGPGIVGDWYLNFGVPGVLLGLFLLGALVAFIILYLMTGGPTIYNVAAYGVLVLMIMHAVEGWIGPGFAEIAKQSVIMLLVYFAGQNYSKIALWLRKS